MAREYTLDADAAKQANTGGQRISETGPYVGKIKAAFYEKNPKGTESVNLMFVADDGREIGPLAMYTHNSNGEELPGYNAFNALMTCLKLRKLAARPGSVDLYDYDSKQVVTKQKDLYAEISGKAIGLFLRREEYEKQSGETGERMVIAGSFDPATRLMANEILAQKTEAHNYDNMLSWLDREPVKKLRNRREPSGNASQPIGSDFADDDIPF